MHESVLAYKKARYAWWALLLLLFSAGLFLSQGGQQPANGGTWQGYTLGGLATVLVLWLTALGIRKRSYHSTMGCVQGWTSAHIYLGIAVLIVTTLHSAGQLGWNAHSLAYVLMCVVVLSGFFGLYAYTRFPRLLAQNRVGRGTDKLFAELNELNEQGLALGRQCRPDIQSTVETAITRTAIGGTLLDQLRGLDRSTVLCTDSEAGRAAVLSANRDQKTVIEAVANRIPRADKKTEAANLQSLLSILCRRQTILRQLRSEICLNAWLQLWLVVHIPATMALLAALVVHILAVFFFW